MENNNFSNVLILSHSQEETVGADDELLKYLVKKEVESHLFQFPFVYSSDGATRITHVVDKEYVALRSRIKFYKPQLISYVKDVISAFFYCKRYMKDNSLIVCSDNILVLSAYLSSIFARFLGKKPKIVYYVIDYTPRRFKNTFLNSIYEWVDKKAFECTDFVWVLNREMINGRLADKGYPKRDDNIAVVPFGNNSLDYTDEDYNNFDINNIVYLGGVYKSKGSELFTDIVKNLIKKGYKDIKLHVIGGGDTEKLKETLKEEGLENNVIVYGRSADQSKTEKLLLKCAVAIAPYNPNDKNSFSFYADPGKVKVYLGCGLPIVITEVPSIYKILVQEKAGLTANYDGKDFADKIEKVMEDIKNYRSNARRLGLKYSWDSIFSEAFDFVNYNEEVKKIKRKFSYSFIDKARFYISYFYYRFVRFFIDIKKDRIKLFIKQLILFSNQLLKTKTDLWKKIYADNIPSRYGDFKVRSDTLDFFCVMSFFERQDITYMEKVISNLLEEEKKVLFIDIGADIGTYSVQIGRIFSNRIKIVSFEPCKESYTYLKENLFNNKVEADVFNVALSDEISEGYLNYDETLPGNNRLLDSQDRLGEKIDIKTMDSVFDSNYFEQQFDTVVIKMDIEGSESKCLKGCNNLLKSGKEIFLLVEDFVDTKIIDDLQNRGFSFITKKTPYNSWWFLESVNEKV
jgi:FkbM family methyltransferase